MRITRTGSGAAARIDHVKPVAAMRRRIQHGGHGTAAINVVTDASRPTLRLDKRPTSGAKATLKE